MMRKRDAASLTLCAASIVGIFMASAIDASGTVAIIMIAISLILLLMGAALALDE